MGVRWLSRQCSVVLYEFATPADENPDVIGWAPGAGSVLIECKLTRSDFLRDAAQVVEAKVAVSPGIGFGEYGAKIRARGWGNAATIFALQN